MDTLVLDLPSVEESEHARRYGNMIGRGAFREVFHIPGTEWAYKFERTDENAWFKTSKPNLVEIENFTNHRDKLPYGVDFPEMLMLDNGVVAVKFIKGVLAGTVHGDWNDCVCASHGIPDCWALKVANIPLKDLHGKNVMICPEDKKIYIIDIGEYGKE